MSQERLEQHPSDLDSSEFQGSSSFFFFWRSLCNSLWFVWFIIQHVIVGVSK